MQVRQEKAPHCFYQTETVEPGSDHTGILMCKHGKVKRRKKNHTHGSLPKEEYLPREEIERLIPSQAFDPLQTLADACHPQTTEVTFMVMPTPDDDTESKKPDNDDLGTNETSIQEDKKQKKLEHGGKKHKQKRVPQATKLLRNDNKVFSMQSDENLPFSSLET